MPGQHGEGALGGVGYDVAPPVESRAMCYTPVQHLVRQQPLCSARVVFRGVLRTGIARRAVAALAALLTAPGRSLPHRAVLALNKKALADGSVQRGSRPRSADSWMRAEAMQT